MKSVFHLIAATTIVSAAVPAAAATLFTTTLSGANETIPNDSTATGSGSLLLSDSMDMIDISLSWTALTGGPATGAHIHCCALPGANGPVAIDFSPPAETTGSVARSYDLTLLATYTDGFLMANGNSAVTARAAFLAGLTSGRTYMNVHNERYPGGEIRGQLAAVPEPASWGMMLLGFAAIGATLRARRSSPSAAAEVRS